MRILLVIAALVAAFIGGILFATRVTGISGTADIGAVPAAAPRDDSVRLAAVPRHETSAEPDATQPADEPARALVHVQPSTTLAGIVHTAEGTPAARVIVGLFAPALSNDGPESAYSAATSMDPRRLEHFRVVRVWTRTNDEGRFAFEDMVGGTWIVRAEEGPLLAAATLPLVVRDGESRLDLVIVLPPAARLEGRAIFPPGMRFDEWCLELRPSAPRSIAPWMHTLVEPVVCVRERLDEDCRFKLGPVEPGLYTVGIVVDRALAKGGRIDPTAGTVSPILDVYLGPGTTTRDIDLTKGIPGMIELHLDLGAFVPNTARAASRFSTGHRIRARLTSLQDAEVKGLGTFEVNSEGATELGPLIPGDWRITLTFPGDSLWSWPLDRSIRVRAGERVRIDAHVPILGAEMVIRDATTGAPFEGIVEIGRDTEDGFTSFGYAPGREGKLWLVLPPGKYLATGREESLQDILLDPSTHSSFEWTETGPSVKSLRVPR